MHLHSTNPPVAVASDVAALRRISAPQLVALYTDPSHYFVAACVLIVPRKQCTIATITTTKQRQHLISPTTRQTSVSRELRSLGWCPKMSQSFERVNLLSKSRSRRNGLCHTTINWKFMTSVNYQGF